MKKNINILRRYAHYAAGIFFAALISATALTSCKNYDDDISSIIDRINELEGTKIAAVDQQIAAISSSITELQAADRALKNLINDLGAKADELQKQLDSNAEADAATKKELLEEIQNIKALIKALQEKDAELDKKIADLKAYVDGEITATKDWATATFATLEQYAEIEEEIAAIKALIEQHKTDITAAYTKAIEDAIATSEASMKEWVNKALADGYYDIAAIDAKLAALETKLAGADTELAKELEDQKAALEQAKSDLTAAYEKAIKDAIENNNGVINQAIADAVQKVLDNVNARLAAIDNEIAAIKKDIEAIKNNIATIEAQIAAINGSINDLKTMDAELKGYIESLQTTADNLQKQLDDTNTKIDNLKKEMGDEIDAVEQTLLNKLDNLKTSIEGELATIKADIENLKAKDAELEGEIAALENYVSTELKNTKDWANATFATLAQYEEIQTAIAGIKGDIAAINTAIANIETRINEKIAADIKAAIDALRTELGADYAAKIKAATDAVTSAYTAAIATAKGEIETAYTKAIADAIAKSEAAMKEWVNAKLQKVYADIAALRIELEALKASAATDEELAAAVTAQQAALEQAKKDLTAAYEAAIKKAIEDNNGVIDDAIADAITAATNDLQSKIDGIKSEIDSIKNRLENLEQNFANRIQSLVFVPQYSDGKILMDYTGRTTQAHFRISPAAIAKLIAVENVKAFARYTNDPTTRAYEPEFPLSVVSVTGDETGMLEVNLKEDSENLFDTDFWAGKKEAVIYIRISDGNSDVVSDAVPMIAHGYGSNEDNSIYGFGDGNTYTGEVTE